MSPNIQFGISLSLMYNARKESFILGAIIILPNGRRFFCKKYYESSLEHCIMKPVISRPGLRKFVYNIDKDIKKVFGENSGLQNVDYEKIYNCIETGRLNAIMHIKVPIEDDEEGDTDECSNGYDNQA